MTIEKSKKFFKSLLPPVKPMVSKIGLCFRGNQVSYRLSSLDKLPDLCGRDIEEGYLFEIELTSGYMNPDLHLEIISKERGQDPRQLGGNGGFLEPWPGHHNEMAEVEEVLKILPGLYFHKSVPSQYEEEVIMACLTKMAERVDRIGFAGPGKFDFREGEKRIGGNGKPHHLQPVPRIDDLLRGLMRGDGRWDEDDFIEAEGLPDLLRSPEMSQMDGIKRPPEEPDSFLWCYRFLFYLRTPRVASF